MPTVPAAMWFVMIGDTETGPMTRVDVGVEAAAGAITGETLVWREGMKDWLPGAKVPELAQLFLNPPKSPRVPGKPPPPPARPPPPPAKKPEGKGMGNMDFDTAHFRLADLAAAKELEGDSGQNRAMEFDTAHFRLQDLGEAQPKREVFTPGGDRLAVPKRVNAVNNAMASSGPIELDLPGKPTPTSQPPLPPQKRDKISSKPRSTLKQASTAADPASAPAAAVKSVRAAPLPKPAAPPPAAKKAPPPPVSEEPFDPNRTSVDFRTLGNLINQQQAAQAELESALAPDAAEVDPEEAKGDPEADKLAKWAAEQIAKEKPEAAPPPARAAKAEPKPTPQVDLAALKAKALAKAEEPPATSPWLYVGIAGGIIAVIAVVIIFLMRD